MEVNDVKRDVITRIYKIIHESAAIYAVAWVPLSGRLIIDPLRLAENKI